ncbi:MAG: hypothetical protein CMM58_04580 [Rhodospirillaceae bacterium]|nr:hypothetical protein [Rhodospirillaceae bacterium]|tara:strand:+ start:1440 stop:2408 length:969 start_codon:yes stop_codon:yes gene_type:complete
MEPSSTQNWKTFLCKLAISIAIISAILFTIDSSKMARGFASITPWILILAVALCFLQMVMAGLRWFLIGKMTGPFVCFRVAFRINFAAMFSNQLLPTSIGGDIVRIGLSRHNGLLVGRAIRTVVFDRTTGLVSLMMLLLVTSLVIEDFLSEDWPSWLIKVGSILFIFSAVATIFFGVKLAARLPEAIYFDWIKKFLREASLLGREGLTTFYAIVISLSIHGTGAFCLWCLTLAVGAEASYLSILGVLPIISLVQLVPISLAGWGVREGTVVAMFSILGIDSSLALLVSLVWGGSIAVSALLSGVIWLLGKSKDEVLLVSNLD